MLIGLGVVGSSGVTGCATAARRPRQGGQAPSLGKTVVAMSRAADEIRRAGASRRAARRAIPTGSRRCSWLSHAASVAGQAERYSTTPTSQSTTTSPEGSCPALDGRPGEHEQNRLLGRAMRADSASSISARPCRSRPPSDSACPTRHPARRHAPPDHRQDQRLRRRLSPHASPRIARDRPRMPSPATAISSCSTSCSRGHSASGPARARGNRLDENPKVS